jgi:hypothetical protein
MRSAIHIEIDDEDWPKLHITMTRGGISPETAPVIREINSNYDIASTQFEPIARDAVRMEIDSMKKKHNLNNKNQGD